MENTSLNIKRDYLLVAAFDIGSTYSGYAFAFRDDQSNIHCNRLWDSGRQHIASLKTPSCILLDKKEDFQAFGYEAENKYEQLVKESKDNECQLFRHFKMHDYQNNAELQDIHGNNSPALRIFSMAISYLRGCLVKDASAKRQVQEHDIKYVLTYSAEGGKAAKAFMEEAAIKAGIDRERLQLLSALKAAAYWCKTLKTNEGEPCICPREIFMVVDLGGNTAEISAFEDLPDEILSEVYAAVSVPYGGTEVDRNYINWLAGIIGASTIKHIQKTHPVSVFDLPRYLHIETQNKEKEEKEIQFVLLPDTVRDEQRSLKETVSDFAQEANVTCIENILRVRMSIYCSWFEYPLQQIANKVKNILYERSLAKVKRLFVVGGFSKYEAVRKKLREAIDKDLNFPPKSELAAVQGAVLSGFSSPRVTDCAYAVRLTELVDLEIARNSFVQLERNCARFGEVKVLIEKGDKISYERDIKTKHQTTTACTHAVVEILETKQSVSEEDWTVKGCIKTRNPSKTPKKNTDIEITVRFDEHFLNVKVLWIKQPNFWTEAAAVTEEKNLYTKCASRAVFPKPSLPIRRQKVKSERKVEDIDWDAFLNALDDKSVVGKNHAIQGKFPDKAQLKRLIQIHSRSASVASLEALKQVDDLVQKAVRRKNPSSKQIWLAYRYESREIKDTVLMIETDAKCIDSTTAVYDLETCIYTEDDFSKEAQTIANYCEIDLSFEDLVPIRKCINSNAKELMKCHRFLSIIKPSSVRSKGFNSPNHNLKEEKCIALYVRKKGYIPVTEKPFRETYGGLRVDVREGAFYTCMQTDKEGIETLKMGMKITRVPPTSQQSNYGTLGGFLEHPEYGTCGITCAHVLLDENEMAQLQEKHVLTWADIPDSRVCLHQDDCFQIGRFVKAVYVNGEDGSSGFEAAIFQINDDIQTAGIFWNTVLEGEDNDHRFEGGKVHSTSRLLSTTGIVKFGARTGKTEGKFTTIMPTITVKLQSDRLTESFELHNQIEVKGDNNLVFSEKGDSGSLVMVKRTKEETLCVGILEGITTENTTIVSPIGPVLERMNVSSLKCFQQDQLVKNVQNLETKVDKILFLLSGKNGSSNS